MMNDFRPVFRNRANAMAIIKGSEEYPDIKGRALFYQTREGVFVVTDVRGLPKGDGACYKPIFAYHIHNGNECSGNNKDPFANAGTHYNPDDCAHPYHSGDMPPLFGVKGKAYSVFLTDRFTVREILGKPVIIHGSMDDFSTQPSGNAGKKIACGIITR